MYIAIGGQRYCILGSRTSRLRELKALSASTRSTASVDWALNISFIACTAASHPPSRPAQGCRFPTELITSGFITDRMALPTIPRSTSPIPIGQIPGFCLKVFADKLNILPGW